ncbi:MAG: hypothetical protein DI556_09835 [Rhodovulum sulfidophilum]|uniref:DUF2634 domain-containing protein n=1 Tax=Rhodovulum sulfidophilum TaxID=35806 RepID=A0A2W5N8G5_RHOSU|nr:MAG: hypothetical protein DI556_09835 [Rhodovulum sulfidophilum]
MRDLLLNADHDLEIKAGDLGIASEDRQQVAQHIKQRLLAIQGEWFLDLSVGLPWFNTILGKHRSLDIVEALLRSQIEGTPRVAQLTAFSLEIDENRERTARVAFAVSLTGGGVINSEFEL